MKTKETKRKEEKLARLFQELSNGELCIFSGLTDGIFKEYPCEKKAVCSHHFIGRANFSTRFLKDNAIPICNKCHNMIESKYKNLYEREIIGIRGDYWYMMLRRKANELFDRDYEKAESELLKELEYKKQLKIYERK